MNRLFSTLRGGFCVCLALSAAPCAQAGAIADVGTTGERDTGVAGDVVGSAAYDIGGAAIARVRSVLSVTAAPAPAGQSAIAYGDLFLASAWSPKAAPVRAAAPAMALAGTVTADRTQAFTPGMGGSSLINLTGFAMHWGETRQSDVIEGYARAVALPGSLPLLALGLGAMLFMRRRNAARAPGQAPPALV